MTFDDGIHQGFNKLWRHRCHTRSPRERRCRYDNGYKIGLCEEYRPLKKSLSHEAGRHNAATTYPFARCFHAETAKLRPLAVDRMGTTLTSCTNYLAGIAAAVNLPGERIGRVLAPVLVCFTSPTYLRTLRHQMRCSVSFSRLVRVSSPADQLAMTSRRSAVLGRYDAERRAVAEPVARVGAKVAGEHRHPGITVKWSGERSDRHQSSQPYGTTGGCRHRDAHARVEVTPGERFVH